MRGLELSSVGVALRAALAGLEATQREAADSAAEDEAARVQAEMSAERERQCMEVGRLAADAAQRAADEEIIEVPEAQKNSDVLYRAFLKRVLDGVACYGVVTDIVQVKKSGIRLDIVRYVLNGKVERLTSDQVRRAWNTRSGAHRLYSGTSRLKGVKVEGPFKGGHYRFSESGENRGCPVHRHDRGVPVVLQRQVPKHERVSSDSVS